MKMPLKSKNLSSSLGVKNQLIFIHSLSFSSLLLYSRMEIQLAFLWVLFIICDFSNWISKVNFMFCLCFFSHEAFMVHLLGAEMDAGHKIEWHSSLLSVGSQSLDDLWNGIIGLYFLALGVGRGSHSGTGCITAEKSAELKIVYKWATCPQFGTQC